MPANTTVIIYVRWWCHVTMTSFYFIIISYGSWKRLSCFKSRWPMQNSQAASPSRDSYYQILIGQSKLWVGSCQDFVVPCDCQFWTLFADWMMFIVFCCFLPFHWQAASTDKHSISQAPAFGDLRLPSGIDVAEFAWLVLAGHLQKPKHSKQHLFYRASIIEYPNVSHWNIFKQIQTRKKMIKFASLSGLVPASHGDLAWWRIPADLRCLYQHVPRCQDVPRCTNSMEFHGPSTWKSWKTLYAPIDAVWDLFSVKRKSLCVCQKKISVCVSFALVMKRKIANNGGGRVAAATWPA